MCTVISVSQTYTACRLTACDVDKHTCVVQEVVPQAIFPLLCFQGLCFIELVCMWNQNLLANGERPCVCHFSLPAAAVCQGCSSCSNWCAWYCRETTESCATATAHCNLSERTSLLNHRSRLLAYAAKLLVQWLQQNQQCSAYCSMALDLELPSSMLGH